MKTVLLVPTEFEWNQAPWPKLPSGVYQVFCGLGPIESAVRTMDAIHVHRPDHVVLAGLAGTYDPTVCAIGQAYRIGSAFCWGVGAGETTGHVTAEDLGWQQYDPDGQGGRGIAFDPESALQVTTVCASAQDERDVARRLDRHPTSVAEDMETWSVALACRRTRTPLVVFRGISNRAGDRTQSHWCTDQAMASVRDQVMEWLCGGWR